MTKVTTFGEIMLRLSTERFLRFSQAKSFNANYGGGEFNVAASLANFGVPSEFVTKLPNNDIGKTALLEINKLNVNSQNIQIGGDRLGLYFLETGSGTRSSNVIYDRNHSSFSQINSETFNWEKILENCSWFHFSGITPALSQNAAEACLVAVKTASKMGITISCDLNYRSKLWNYGKEPNQIMPELLKYANVILGDIDTAYFMLGEEKVNPDYSNTEDLPKLYNKIYNYCPELKYIATTLRYSVSASHQRIGGILYDKKEIYKAEVKDVTPVVDRVGSGDAFMAGLLYGLISHNKNLQKTINIAVAACCLKHTIYGDYNLVTVDEIENFINGENKGKVSR